MIQYRLYFLHESDNGISLSHEFEAENDERAVRTAEAWREGRRAELWSGARMIRSWDVD